MLTNHNVLYLPAKSKSVSEKTELIPIIGTENETRRGDVVFVHGLGGDGRGTWHPEEKKDDDNFWPFWLGEDLEGVWKVKYYANRLSIFRTIAT